MPNLGEQRTRNGLGEYWNGIEWVTGGTPEILYGFDPATTPGAGQSPSGARIRTFNGLGYHWDPAIGGWRVGLAGADQPGYNAAAAALATPPASTPASTVTQPSIEQQVMQDIAGNRERTLELLRQRLMGQQNQNINALRQQLGQRGLLDSGSLGAGTVNIGNRMFDLMNQGVLQAGTIEGEQRLNELLAQQGNIWQGTRDRALSGYEWNRMMEQQRHQTREREAAQQWQQDMQPKWWESALGNLMGGVGQGIGQVGGTALANYYGSRHEDDSTS